MPDRELDCLADADAAAKPLRARPPRGPRRRLLDALPEPQAAFRAATRVHGGGRAASCCCPVRTGSPARCSGWRGTGPPWRMGRPAARPAGGHGLAARARRLRPGGGGARLLPRRLPVSTLRRQAQAARRRCWSLPAGCDAAVETARAAWLARDLINTPANLLGPAELAEAALAAGGRGSAPACAVVEGEALARGLSDGRRGGRRVGARAAWWPTIRWPGSGAGPTRRWSRCAARASASIPAATTSSRPPAMLRMKKDMGGAALMLGLARADHGERPAGAARRSGSAASRTWSRAARCGRSTCCGPGAG